MFRSTNAAKRRASGRHKVPAPRAVSPLRMSHSPGAKGVKVYYGAAPARASRGSRTMTYTWAAWSSGDPRKARGTTPDLTGSARDRSAVPDVIRALFAALLGATNVKLVEVPCESVDEDERPRRMRKPVTKPRRPGWARMLGLTLPCTRDDVARAYRSRAYACHPDRGGVAAEFIAITSARDEALAALGA